MSNQFFENVTWPAGAIYNIKPKGGFKYAGSADVDSNSSVITADEFEERWAPDDHILVKESSLKSKTFWNRIRKLFFKN